MHVARSTCEAGRGLLPQLRDMHVVRVVLTYLTLAGFESVENRKYAQMWFCRLSTPWQTRGKPEDLTGDCVDWLSARSEM